MNDNFPTEKPARTLLVVDDQEGVRVSLKFLLEGAGYRIIVADSCATALLLAETEALDGALIDVHMPVVNGFETCQRLQAQAATRGTALKIWFMTGAGTRAIQQRAGELGWPGVLSKPFDCSAFLLRLQSELSPADSPAPNSSAG